MSEFKTIANKSSIPVGKLKEVKVNNKVIIVANRKGTYLACDGLCTHKQCPLAGGILMDKILTCFCHGAKFDIETGKALSGPAIKDLHIYKVKLKGEEIQVEI